MLYDACDTMELIENIFRRRKLDYGYWDSRIKGRSGEIALEQVRLLLYKECDRRGRKVLFDSSTIDKVLANKNDKPNFTMDKIPRIVEVSEGNAYIYKGEAKDASVLGEMIFGAVAMNCKSVSLKIHIMNDPKRLMCTKLFSVPILRRVSRTEKKIENSDVKRSIYLREEGVSLSFSIDRGDSGFYGEQSSYSSLGTDDDYFSMFDSWRHNSSDEYFFHSPSSGKSSSSSGSLARRASRSLATRFDLGNNMKAPTSTTVCSADSQLYGSSTSTTDSLASATSTRRSKLGLALLINFAESDDMERVRGWCERAPQLQALVSRVRRAALRPARARLVSALHAAAGDARAWLSDLVYGPRLQPVWLNLVTSESKNTNKMADTLLSDLCFVLAVGDTKETNFFMSTLITFVLTYHLGWVTTVSPYDTVDVQESSGNVDSRRHYNVLFAQLSDLCGSIGFPPRSARTIIAGSKNVQFINKLLSVLTYFIRCGEVRKNEYNYQDGFLSEAKVISVKNLNVPVDNKNLVLKDNLKDSLKVPSHRSSGSSVSTLVSSEVPLKKSATFTDINHRLSNINLKAESSIDSRTQTLKRHPTVMISLQDMSDSSPNLSSEESEVKKVVFVLGDDEKLVGLKNKANGGKSVRKKSKVSEAEDTEKSECKDICKEKNRSSTSPSKCCGQTLKHSKPIKHSGFKFEFDKYPQIVTNYMKSKNLEILDRHYIGKPGNLKLDNFQFDPTFVPPIQEERCETCYKCQLMESMLQTPTNASEMEYMNDMPRQSEPQFAKETIVDNEQREMSPKTFVRKRKESTVVVNVRNKESAAVKVTVEGEKDKGKDRIEVKQVIEFPVLPVCNSLNTQSGYEASLLGGLTNHYVPDLVLQGTIASPDTWESELRRDLDLTSYLSKSFDAPVQSVAIVGDTNTWRVSLVGAGAAAAGLAPLVGGALDALTHMTRARVPPTQCLLFLESKLRELCVISKTLADMLMTTDFCDIETLTKSLNVDVNDVPLLLAVATTHTPQLSSRYGISYSFMSTLITFVLTYHLGWVTTVSPYDTVDVQESSGNVDSRRHYNVLFAQLSDLCGSIGFPPRSARTIIAGSKNVQFINKLLSVLTYFIRCGEVRKNEYNYPDGFLSEAKVISVKNLNVPVDSKNVVLKDNLKDSLKVPSHRSSGSSVSTLVSSEVPLKKSATFTDINHRLSNINLKAESSIDGRTQTLKRHPTVMISLQDMSDSSPNLSSEESEAKKVVFVLGDDEKLVGLKNKANGGKSVRKKSKVSEAEDTEKSECKDICKEKNRSSTSPSKCCGQTLKHSKPIKHSGFKFEFDKYPQIVTNYMKSKNLEILDRHYIGKPGNLKLDNFQFDPTFVPPIQEERCETCYKCQLMESMLQTPTNASEMEYMNDMPRQSEPQFAKETIVDNEQREMSPKTFVRKRKESTIVVNVRNKESAAVKVTVEGEKDKGKDRIEVKQVIEFPVLPVCNSLNTQSGYEASLLGGLTNHYVPDLVLQGTIASPDTWESELRRDLDLTSYLSKSFDAPVQSVAIVGDTNTWRVSLVGAGAAAAGLAPLVGGALDALTHMTRARVPPTQCLLFLESKLRELCVISKTLADMLMTTDFCDIETLTKSLNVDVNDVPLLLAVATTHTPQLSSRYGISYR